MCEERESKGRQGWEALFHSRYAPAALRSHEICRDWKGVGSCSVCQGVPCGRSGFNFVILVEPTGSADLRLFLFWQAQTGLIRKWQMCLWTNSERASCWEDALENSRHRQCRISL